MRRMVAVTQRQKAVLDAIAGFIAEKGYSPSFPEIATLCNYTSLATVAKHVNNLERKGLIASTPNTARSITILRGPDPRRCPLCGHDKARVSV
jgi:repressor LexA